MLLIKDFVTSRLTGVPASDFGDMGAAGLLNLRTRGYAPELLESFGIPEVAGALPPLHEQRARRARWWAPPRARPGCAPGRQWQPGCSTPVPGRLGQARSSWGGCAPPSAPRASTRWWRAPRRSAARLIQRLLYARPLADDRRQP
ncbi:FGGY family carbohydrate kinase [Kouleothrix sp.]|uniref:FGGY family carbohydrate kinase n=1 Tax=Kouleothrix sp. TaxID=2779161 RepID=UPI00391BF7E8